jgi:hypothetical protein
MFQFREQYMNPLKFSKESGRESAGIVGGRVQNFFVL